MTTFMTRYKTTEWFDLKFEKKKSYPNGSLELVNISCKHILSTSAMYICHGSQGLCTVVKGYIVLSRAM